MQEIAHAVGLPDYQLARELDRLRRGRRVTQQTAESLGDMSEPLVLDDETDGEGSPPPCEPAETALLYLLWTSKELRMGLDVTDTVRLFQDERLKDIAAALLTGEDPDTLERRWLELGEHFPLSAVAAGGEFCDTLSGTERERWATLAADLRRRGKQARYARLREMMFRGQATPDEMAEYAALAAELKRH